LRIAAPQWLQRIAGDFRQFVHVLDRPPRIGAAFQHAAAGKRRSQRRAPRRTDLQCRIPHEPASAGDYLYIPAGMPHVAVNRSALQPAVFIGARNEATAQESLDLRPDLDGRVPA